MSLEVLLKQAGKKSMIWCTYICVDLAANSVFVEPGHRVVIVTPVPLSSELIPFDTDKIYDFVAA